MNKIIRYLKLALGIYLNKPFIGPYSVQLGLSDVCNYQCVMCNVFARKSTGSYQGGNRSLMEFNTAKEVLYSLAEMGTKNINLCGYGETLIYPRIKEIVAIAKELKMKVDITTNGYFLSKELIDDFSDSKLDGFYISLNSSSKQTYALIHEGSKQEDFSRILEAINYAKSKGITVVLSFVVMSINYREIIGFIDLAEKLKVDEIIFRELGIGYLTDKSLILNKEAIDELRKLNRNKLSSVANNFRSFLDVLGYQKKKAVDCFAGFIGGSIITAQGSVFPCCNCSDSIGNIYENNIKSIWYSFKYQSFRRLGKNMHKDDKYPTGCLCKTCPTYTINSRVQHILFPWRKLF
ncbi:MAG: radical SAM protein [Candidatus Omnitrophica bacterium]|nr:radical SAM protein [Candidatus Omnitrophota bacterium]